MLCTDCLIDSKFVFKFNTVDFKFNIETLITILVKGNICQNSKASFHLCSEFLSYCKVWIYWVGVIQNVKKVCSKWHWEKDPIEPDSSLRSSMYICNSTVFQTLVICFILNYCYFLNKQGGHRLHRSPEKRFIWQWTSLSACVQCYIYMIVQAVAITIISLRKQIWAN